MKNTGYRDLMRVVVAGCAVALLGMLSARPASAVAPTLNVGTAVGQPNTNVNITVSVTRNGNRPVAALK